MALNFIQLLRCAFRHYIYPNKHLIFLSDAAAEI